MITSVSNPQIKFLGKLIKKAKFRREQGLFAAEGVKMAAEAEELKIAETIYATETGLEALKERLGREPDCETELISEQVLSAVADTVSPQGVLALVTMPEYDLEKILCQEQANLLFLEEIRDPGNLGTMVRTAECAGVNGIILSGGCVDLFNPKTVRATMGAVFRVPFAYTGQFPAAMGLAKKNGIRIFGAHLQGAADFFAEDYRGKTAFVIGNEANGMSPAAAAESELVKIPMEGGSESLNASVAAAVMMYEAYRQKRKGNEETRFV